MEELLFIGGMFPKDSEEIGKNSRGNVQNAANVLQWGILNALKEDGRFRVKTASLLFIGAYPKLYRKLFVKGAEVLKDIDYIGFFNAPILKNISRYFRLRRYLRRKLKEVKEKKVYVVAYSAHTPFIKAIAKEKKRRDLHFHLIVPDLPMYMNLSKEKDLLYTVFKMADTRVQNKYLSAVDSFTFLTENMSEVFNRYGKPYTVVEGMIDLETAGRAKGVKKEELTLVYTGTLNEQYGILGLVSAMKYVKNECRLIICGKGDAEEAVKKAAKEDERIDYRGIVPYEEALKIQSEATVLINPRTADGEYTKYSFPSKNLEYMMWEKPVLTFRLEGIPKEYDDILLYFPSKEEEDMGRTIDAVLNKTQEELEEIGKKTTAFALHKKNNKKQTEKIIACMLCERSAKKI